jgi:hypothetical protein
MEAASSIGFSAFCDCDCDVNAHDARSFLSIFSRPLQLAAFKYSSFLTQVVHLNKVRLHLVDGFLSLSRNLKR